MVLTLLLNPFNIVPTSAFLLTALMLLVVTVIAFTVFVWREQPRDERKAMHGLYAERVAYFAAGAVLALVIIV